MSTWIQLQQAQTGREETWVNVDSVKYLEALPAGGTKLYFAAGSTANAGTEQSLIVKEPPEEIFKKARQGPVIKL
jgi:hypothetical protein